ncbi:hypothetical protein P3454_26165, partial [Vibrio parahaemolyticus]|nr:hypothetical protein [Vibrio parahaemolyticus]
FDVFFLSLFSIRLVVIDPLLSPAPGRRLANHNVAPGHPATQLCSIDSNAVVSDFLHFQAGFVDLELNVVPGARRVLMILVTWRGWKKIYVSSLFQNQNQTLKSVGLAS